MRVSVHHHLDDLEDDLSSIARQAPRDMIRTVREGVRVGNSVAKDFARDTSGAHAKKYPSAFTAEMHGLQSTLTGHGLYSGEYGPRPEGQGLLGPILESGSRNNPAHLNLARSADLMGPALQGEVRRLPDGWFW